MLSISDNKENEDNRMRRLSFSSQSSYESDDDDLANINKMYSLNNYQDMGLDMDNEIEETLFGKQPQESLANVSIKEMQTLNNKNTSFNLDEITKKKRIIVY